MFISSPPPQHQRKILGASIQESIQNLHTANNVVTYLNNRIFFLILVQLTNIYVYIFVPENSVFRKQYFIFFFHIFMSNIKHLLIPIFVTT